MTTMYAPPKRPEAPPPRGRGMRGPHRNAWIAAVIAVALVAGGGVGVGVATSGTSSPPGVTSSQPAAPHYDKAGFLAAVTGSEFGAVQSDLNNVSTDAGNYDATALESDGNALETDAGAWLAKLEATNPPPAYQPVKEDLIAAATHFRDAGRHSAEGAAAGDPTMLNQAASELNQGTTELNNATADLPTSP